MAKVGGQKYTHQRILSTSGIGPDANDFVSVACKILGLV
jgi:hypothetical protein